MEYNQQRQCGRRCVKKDKADLRAASDELQEVAKCRFSLLLSQDDIKEPNSSWDVNTAHAVVDAMLRKVTGLS